MKGAIFLDSSALYALVDRSDAAHERVAKVYRNARNSFVTHSAVLMESFSLIAKRLHRRAACEAVGATRNSPRLQVVHVDEALLSAAWSRALRYDDKDWDWIDCASFEVMDLRQIRRALTLDRHFIQAGFDLVVKP